MLECDSSKHAGDKTVIEGDAKTQPFGWNMPDGSTVIVCAADVMNNADATADELAFLIAEAFQTIATAEADKLRVALASHRAELRKRNAVRG